MVEDFNGTYVSAAEAAQTLDITPAGLGRVIQSGRVPAVKVANRWLLQEMMLKPSQLLMPGNPAGPEQSANTRRGVRNGSTNESGSVREGQQRRPGGRLQSGCSKAQFQDTGKRKRLGP